tara:strand:- start:42 stop:1379 length:1338 start_codon:yes stop_codon:yes gene_type:complete
MDNILILGSGLSGMGACKLAIKQKLNIRISDSNKILKRNKSLFKKFNILWEEGRHSFSNLDWADYIIKSPGISNQIDLLQAARVKKIPVISEIEFAYRYINNSKIIAVTGSNGKTTTSQLIYYILKKAGFKVEVCGNSFDSSFSEKISLSSSRYYVLELSSFQLENIVQFKPDISILLNLSPDHLDRYDFDPNQYYETKMKIQSNQKKDNFFIYFSNDENIKKRLNKCSEVILKPFGDFEKSNKNFAWVYNKKLIINHKKIFTMVLHDMALQGRHNVYNSMAAGIAAKILGVNNDTLRECLTDFKGVEHRLEPVLKLDDKLFINDSKATNCNSVFFALETIESPIIWICGGVDKGNDYSILNTLVKDKVDIIFTIGDCAKKIENHFKKIVPNIIEVKSMQDAVVQSNQLSSPGHTILLSPACSSFDMFQDYQERGRIFKECVFNL